MTSALFNPNEFNNCETEPYQLLEEINLANVKGNEILYETDLSKLFFSQSNIDFLQEQFIMAIYDKTHIQISPQSSNDLLIIMKSIYLQNSKNLNTELTKQVNILNKYVMDYSINNIHSNMKQYDKYIKDLTSEKQILNHPEFVKDNKTYDLSAINNIF